MPWQTEKGAGPLSSERLLQLLKKFQDFSRATQEKVSPCFPEFADPDCDTLSQQSKSCFIRRIVPGVDHQLAARDLLEQVLRRQPLAAHILRIDFPDLFACQ